MRSALALLLATLFALGLAACGGSSSIEPRDDTGQTTDAGNGDVSHGDAGADALVPPGDTSADGGGDTQPPPGDASDGGGVDTQPPPGDTVVDGSCDAKEGCALAVQLDQCCGCPHAMSLAEIEADPCAFEAGALPSPVPAECTTSCPEIPCAPCQTFAGVACEDGACVEVPEPPDSTCQGDGDCALAHRVDQCCSCPQAMTLAQIDADPCVFPHDVWPEAVPEGCEADCEGVMCDECLGYMGAVCVDEGCAGVPMECCQDDTGCANALHCVGGEFSESGGRCLPPPDEGSCYDDGDCSVGATCEGETICSCDMNCLSDPGFCAYKDPGCAADGDCSLAVKIDDCCYCPMAMTQGEMDLDPCVFPVDGVPDPIPEACVTMCLGVACEACMLYAGAECAGGACVPVVGQGECCYDDSGCQGDLVCARSDPSYMGTCVTPPPEGRCWSDGHCPEGSVCTGAAICPCGWDCDMDMMEGPGFCGVAACFEGAPLEEGIGAVCAPSNEPCPGLEADLCTSSIFSDPTLPAMCTRYCNDLTPCPEGSYCHPAGWSSSCVPDSCADPFVLSCTSDLGCKIGIATNVCCGCPHVFTLAQIELNPCIFPVDTPPESIPSGCQIDCPAIVCEPCFEPAGVDCVDHRCVPGE
jgi:hypothetical protein